MEPYTLLKEMLLQLGAEPALEELHPQAFGSAFAIYGTPTGRIRLVWDGKEGWGFVQREEAPESWVDASLMLKRGDLQGISPNHEKIADFKRVVTQLLLGAA